MFNFQFFILFITINCIVCFTLNHTEIDYGGESFPVKYLKTDTKVSILDINLYLKSLNSVLNYFGEYPNDTLVNTGVCAFLTQTILKRSLKDYKEKVQGSVIHKISKLINTIDIILSHYVYKNSVYGWNDKEFRVTKLFDNVDVSAYSIENFNKYRLTQHLFSNNNINTFIRAFDEATLPKEQYIEILEDMFKYHMNIKDSDYCISIIPYNGAPLSVSEMKPCKPDQLCEHCMYSDPSVGYALSHRQVNLIMRRIFRRCYVKSEKVDSFHLDMLCANMFREAVYLARRGFFGRDMFLEHIAFCGLLGYEEFHRTPWFRKAASWVSKHGCTVENKNFRFNHSKLIMKTAGNNLRLRRQYHEYACKTQDAECQDHPTALLMIVLAHGIRHALHFLK